MKRLVLFMMAVMLLSITVNAQKKGKRLSKYIFYSSFSLLTFATKK